MRALHVSLSALCILFQTRAVDAQSANDFARSISANIAIRESCARFYKINHELLSRMEMAFTEMGRRTAGAASFDLMVQRERERRQEEIRFQGAEDWCKFKKTEYTASGLTAIFQ